MQKIDLKDVTLCAADSVNPSLTATALDLSARGCAFGDAILFSDKQMDGSFRHVPIERLASRDAYGAFVLKQLPLLVKAPFVLLVQWDGYVIDPASWLPEFRHYDYIGAKWTGYRDGLTVGNGGFSLRSRKLLQALALPRFTVPENVNEDEYICRVQRSVLERDHGIRFAPETIADCFSYERSLPERPTFGFHGMFNMWRHIEDAEMVKVVDQLGAYLIASNDYAETLMTYFALRKFAPLRAFYARLRNNRNAQQVYAHLNGIIRNEKWVADCVRSCESLLGQ